MKEDVEAYLLILRIRREELEGSLHEYKRLISNSHAVEVLKSRVKVTNQLQVKISEEIHPIALTSPQSKQMRKGLVATFNPSFPVLY